MSLVQDSAFGQLVRLATGNRVFAHPENQLDFQLPWKNTTSEESDVKKETEAGSDAHATAYPNSVRASEGNQSERPGVGNDAERPGSPGQQQDHALEPQTTPDGITLIDWYTTNDPANPTNWTSQKKFISALIISLYTFGVYSCSAIITPAHGEIMRRFNVSYAEASLGLAMYVIGYGFGPLLFSPLSEIPMFGRNIPYVTSYALYVILSVPTALVDNFAGLLVLRFLTGFLGSPCLATGAATMQDIYSITNVPYAIIGWTAAAFAGPALGPTISGFAVSAKNWRWSLWPILWLNGPIFLSMFFFLPETLGANILYRRARRLRKLTGNMKLMSKSEIDQKSMTLGSIVAQQLVKPFEISFKDPAVLFVNIYTAVIYGTYYGYFEAFPLAYPVVYGFNIGETSLTFLCFAIGCVIAAIFYASLYGYYALPRMMKIGMGPQEDSLIPALLFSMLLPAGMFWWGWTIDSSIHWIVSCIGMVVFTIGAYVLMQCIFTYLPMSYPQYAASLFAANDFFRSAMAGAAIIWGHPLYQNLGVGRGVSVLAGLMCGGVLGVWALWYWGASLRKRSKFAIS